MVYAPGFVEEVEVLGMVFQPNSMTEEIDRQKRKV